MEPRSITKEDRPPWGSDKGGDDDDNDDDDVEEEEGEEVRGEGGMEYCMMISVSTSFATCPLSLTPRRRYLVPAECLDLREISINDNDREGPILKCDCPT